ncbi:MAG: NAD(P)H-hydrate dehydratase [Thermoguttaceae bacterium]
MKLPNHDILYEYSKTLPVLPRRDLLAHKGDFGAVLGIGGSLGMSGAISLAGQSALLAGAGLVRLAVPNVIQQTVASFCPSYTTISCLADKNGRFSFRAIDTIRQCAENATSLFIGPGLGQSGSLDRFVVEILNHCQNRKSCQKSCQNSCNKLPQKLSQKPILIDADGLNALHRESFFVKSKSFAEANRTSSHENTMLQNMILTPHSGEFARISGLVTPSEHEMDRRIIVAKEFAQNHHLILVLKGHHTIITNGIDVAVNSSGNPGMATGGSGDVLTGLIAGIVAGVDRKLFSVYDAARTGVFIHGLAGDLAANKNGIYSVAATSILGEIPNAFKLLNIMQNS